MQGSHVYLGGMGWWTIIFLVLFGLNSTIVVAQEQNVLQANDDAQMALQAFTQKDYPLAVHLYERLVERDPSRGLFWFNLGNSRFMAGDYAGAEISYRKVVALNGPLSVPARIYLTKALRKQEKLHSAREVLEALSTQSLSEPLRRETDAERDTLRESFDERAIAVYRQGDFAEVFPLLDASRALGSGIDATTLRGLALLNLGRPSEAREVFQSILATEARTDTDRALQQEARSFIADIEDGKWPKEIPFWLFSELAAGYNTNVFGDAEADGPVSRTVATFFSGFGYQHPLNSHSWVQVAYDVAWNEVWDESSARFVDNALSLLGIWDNRIWRLQMQTGVVYDLVDTGSFLWGPGGAFMADRYFGSGRFGLRYAYRRNLAGSSLYDYLSGDTHSGNIHWKYTGSVTSFGVLFSAARDATGDLVLSTGTLPLANTSFGPGFDFHWRFVPRWKIEGYSSYLFLNYSNVSQPTGRARDDRRWTGTVRLSFSLTPSLDLFVSGSGTLNHSTLTAADLKDKNYRQLIALGGLSWNILP
ncbi:MAG: tetratricopeptide repeat protein [Pseudomonadota bacterium]